MFFRIGSVFKVLKMAPPFLGLRIPLFEIRPKTLLYPQILKVVLGYRIESEQTPCQ